jgi:hypothetical protein
MPFDPELSEREHAQADEVSADYDRRAARDAEALAAREADVVERGSQAARALLGAENWQALRRRVDEERRAFSDALQPPAGLGANYEALVSDRRTVMRKYVEGLGIDTGRLREIRDRTAVELTGLRPAVDAETVGFASWLEPDRMLTTAHADTHDADTHDADTHDAGTHDAGTHDDPHAWFTFRAPFPGFQSGFGPGNNTGAFRTAANRITNTASGQVGYDLMTDNNDASDVDQGGGTVDAQMAFRFRAPTAGQVEIQIDARCDDCLHQLRTVDEFGFSSSSTEQRNFLMAHVVHPAVNGPSTALMSRFVWNTDDDSFVQRRFLQLGGLFGARLRSNGNVRQGDVFDVRAGTRGIDGILTNDVSIHSLSSFRWTLQSVFVRIAP